MISRHGSGAGTPASCRIIADFSDKLRCPRSGFGSVAYAVQRGTRRSRLLCRREGCSPNWLIAATRNCPSDTAVCRGMTEEPTDGALSRNGDEARIATRGRRIYKHQPDWAIPTPQGVKNGLSERAQ